MKFSFSTVGCPNWTLTDVLSTARDFGYDGVEFRGLGAQMYLPRAAQFTPERVSVTMNELRSRSLDVPCLASNVCFLDAEADFMAECADYIRLAKLMGVPYVRVLGDYGPGAGASADDDMVKRGLAKALPLAQDAGVTLLIETNGVYADSARLAALVSNMRSDALGVLWDTHHPFRFFGETPAKTWELLGEHIRHTHFKDSLVGPGGHIRYRMVTQGDLPIADLVDTLKHGGFDGYASLEWVKRWNAELEEPGIVFSQYINAMKRLI